MLQVARVREYRRLLAAVRPHLSLLAAAIASMLVLSAATGAFSWLVGPMFQFVFKGGALDAGALRSALPFLHAPETISAETALRALPLLILAIAAVRGIAYFGQFYCMGMLGQRVVADMRLALHQKLLELAPAFFARSSSGDLLQPPGEPDDGKDRERNGDERQQRQPPVESDGDAEQDQNLKTIAQVRGEAVGEGELHRRHVACEAREKIAR